jgi:hypothetical protein
MARVLLDALSHQAIRAEGTEAQHYAVAPDQAGRWRGVRLTGFEAALAASGHSLGIEPPVAAALAEANVLVIASRSQLLPFSAKELEAIAGFVRGGGGLLLMANHRGMIAPQQQVAQALGLPVAFADVTLADFPRIAVLTGPGQPPGELRVRNCCALRLADGARPLAAMATEPPLAFAAAAALGAGRVVATGDSGFLASRDDAGLDLWSEADNARFVMSALGWLAG